MKPSINGGSWASGDSSTITLQNIYGNTLSRATLNRNEIRFKYENSVSSSENFEYIHTWTSLNKLKQLYQNVYQQNYPANYTPLIENGTGWYAIAASGWTPNIADNTWPFHYTLSYDSVYNYSAIQHFEVEIIEVNGNMVLTCSNRAAHSTSMTVNYLQGVRIVREARTSDNAQRLRLDIKISGGTSTNSFYITLVNKGTFINVRSLTMPGSLSAIGEFISNSDTMKVNDTLLGSCKTPYRTEMLNNNMLYINNNIRNDPYICLQNFPQITLDNAKSFYIDFTNIPYLGLLLSMVTGAVGKPVLYYISVHARNPQKIRIAGYDQYDPLTISMTGNIGKFSALAAGTLFNIIVLGAQSTLSLYMNLTYDDN